MLHKKFSLLVLIALLCSYSSMTLSVQDYNGIEIIVPETDKENEQKIQGGAFFEVKKLVEENVFGREEEVENIPSTPSDVSVEQLALEAAQEDVAGLHNVVIEPETKDVENTPFVPSDVSGEQLAPEAPQENIAGLDNVVIELEIKDVENMSSIPSEQQDPQDQNTLENNVSSENKESVQMFWNISFNKRTLLFFGVGAVALITVGGVTYVLYKNGSLKKVGKFFAEHKISIATATVATAVALAAGIYAKQKGITFEHAQSWILKFFKKQEQKSSEQ